jgi:uncharacterized membrane protein YfcA
LVFPAVIGSLIGAFIAAVMSAPAMDAVIGVLMVVMFLIVLVDPNSWVKDRQDQPPLKTVVAVPDLFSYWFIWWIYSGWGRILSFGGPGAGMWF